MPAATSTIHLLARRTDGHANQLGNLARSQPNPKRLHEAIHLLRQAAEELETWLKEHAPAGSR